MILVLNCGSQSIKWKLFEKKSVWKLKKQGQTDVLNIKNYKNILIKELEKIVGYKKNIKIIGHRVVYGGPKFRDPTLITKKN